MHHNKLYQQFKNMNHAKKHARSEKIRKRLIACCNNGELFMHDELQIFAYFLERYPLKTISEVAKQQGKTYNGIKQRLEAGKEMSISTGGKTFII